MSLFDNVEYRNSIVKSVIQSTMPPYKSVRANIIPDPEGDPCLYLVLYLENFASHSEPQQSSIAEWAGAVITKIREAGIPCYLTRIKEEE